MTNRREVLNKKMQQRNNHLRQQRCFIEGDLYSSSKRYDWASGGGGTRGIKRWLDIVVSALMLVLFSPLFFVIALLIKCTDRGPILFWQVRVGLWGREFRLPKFRSMVADAEELKNSLLAQSHHADCTTFKMKHDPRVTGIGRITRKLSLDELPQLWCVLTGEMSLVGPRPPMPNEVVKYTIAEQRRLSVTPGLTCIWQVSGRGDLPFNEQIVLDVQYIESQSLWLDLVLLLRTIPAVLSGSGAY